MTRLPLLMMPYRHVLTGNTLGRYCFCQCRVGLWSLIALSAVISRRLAEAVCVA